MSDAGNEVWGGMLPELPAPANIDVDIPEFSPMCTRAEATELIEERLGPLIARLDQHENRIAQLENEVLRLQHENANLRRGPVAFEEQRMPAVQAGDRPLKMKLPDTYEGDRSALQDWLDQIALYQFGNMQGAPESRHCCQQTLLL